MFNVLTVYGNKQIKNVFICEGGGGGGGRFDDDDDEERSSQKSAPSPGVSEFKGIISPVKYSVADPDPGSGAFLTPGSGMGRKSASGIRDEQPGSYFLELRNHFLFYFFGGVKILKFFDADPGSGIETVRIWDGKSRIRDKHPDSATLVKYVFLKPIPLNQYFL